MLSYIFTIVLSLSLVQSSAGSQASLTADPGVINEGLTDSLTLRCTLQDESTSGNPGTSYDIEHVSSILVFRGSASSETQIARIIGSDPAEALADLENLQVTGDLNPARPTDPEFLELVWTRPTVNQTGRYRCEVHVLDMLGRGVVLKSKADVKSEVPSIQQLIAEIINLKNVTSILKPPHTEQGVVYCPSSASWRPEGSDSTRAFYNTVQFEKPYAEVPVVSVGVTLVDTDPRMAARYRIDVSDVSRTGFKIACKTWYGSIVYGLRVRWTSTVA